MSRYFDRIVAAMTTMFGRSKGNLMTLRGRIRGGMIVLDKADPLPEGAEVEVVVVGPVETPPLGATLAEIGRWAETFPTDMPSDFAANHDHYLHGLPKRKP